MYALTICKIEKDTNRWAGFNQNLTIGLEGDLIKELDFYGVEFEKGSAFRVVTKEIEWKNYTVFIQYLRIN